MTRSHLVAVVAGLLALACASSGDTATSAPTPTSADTAPASTSTSTLASSTTAPTTTDPTTTSKEPAVTTVDEEEADDRADCLRLADFDDAEANQRWLVVNDNVMGGQSLGGLSFEAGTLIFEGDINTDGGGFSSLRLPLDPGVLTPFGRVELRARPDDRSYMVTFDDGLPGRDRRVSHRAPIGFGTAGEWQTVSVAFDELFPAIFGRPIDDLPFRPDLATRMGLMISDGFDGPFRLEVDWIDVCAS